MLGLVGVFLSLVCGGRFSMPASSLLDFEGRHLFWVLVQGSLKYLVV